MGKIPNGKMPPLCLAIGAPSIKQVLPAEKQKEHERFCSCSFLHVLRCKGNPHPAPKTVAQKGFRAGDIGSYAVQRDLFIQGPLYIQQCLMEGGSGIGRSALRSLCCAGVKQLKHQSGGKRCVKCLILLIVECAQAIGQRAFCAKSGSRLVLVL